LANKRDKRNQDSFRNLQQELATGFDRLVNVLDTVVEGQKDIVTNIKKGPSSDTKKPKTKPPKIPVKNAWKELWGGTKDRTKQVAAFAQKAGGKSWKNAGKNFSSAFTRGIPKMGREILRTVTRSFSSITSSLKGTFSAITGQMGDMGSLISNIFTFSISGMMSAMFDLAKQVGMYEKDMVLTFGMLKKRNIELASIAKHSGLSLEELGSGFNKLTSEFGTGMSTISSEQMKSWAILAKNLSISGDELGGILGTYQLIGGLTLEQSEILAENTALLAHQQDVAPDKVMKDIAESGEDFAKFSKGGVKNFINTAVAARKLGVSMKTVTGSLSGMLNLEDSITKEMQASVMLGQRVNFMDVRRLSLAGDQLGAFKALRRELRGIDMNNLDPLTMQALADATHMTATDLTKLARGEELDIKPDPMVATAEATSDIAKSLKTAMDWLTPFEKFMAEMSDKFIKMGDKAMLKLVGDMMDLVLKALPHAIRMMTFFGGLIKSVMQSTAFEKIGKLFASIFSSERMESFNDQFTKLLDLLLKGDFGGFWDEFIKGIQPAFKKLLESIKPAFDRAVDDVFGTDSKIGSWMKGLFEPKDLTKNLDKILIGFMAFKMGIMSIITPLLLVFTHLALGLTKLVGNIGWEALKGTGRQLSSGIFGHQYKKDGPRVGGLFGKRGGMGKKAWGGPSMKMGGALALASVAEAAIEVGLAFSQASKEMDPVKRAKDTRKAWSKGVGAVVGGAVGAFFGPVGVAVGVQAGKYVGGWMSGLDVFQSELEKTQLEATAAGVAADLAQYQFIATMNEKLTTGLDAMLGEGGKWDTIIQKAGGAANLSATQFTDLAQDLKDAKLPGVTKTAIEGVIAELKAGTLKSTDIYEALALAAKDNIIKATEDVADFAADLSKKLGLDDVAQRQKRLTEGLKTWNVNKESVEALLKVEEGKEGSNIANLEKIIYDSIHHGFTADTRGKGRLPAEEIKTRIMGAKGFTDAMTLMARETKSDIGTIDYMQLQEALFNQLVHQQAQEGQLGYGSIDYDDIIPAMTKAIQNVQAGVQTTEFSLEMQVAQAKKLVYDVLKETNLGENEGLVKKLGGLVTTMLQADNTDSQIVAKLNQLFENKEAASIESAIDAFQTILDENKGVIEKVVNTLEPDKIDKILKQAASQDITKTPQAEMEIISMLMEKMPNLDQDSTVALAKDLSKYGYDSKSLFGLINGLSAGVGVSEENAAAQKMNIDQSNAYLSSKFHPKASVWDNPATPAVVEDSRDAFLQSLKEGNIEQTGILQYILKELVNQRILGVPIFKQS